MELWRRVPYNAVAETQPLYMPVPNTNSVVEEDPTVKKKSLLLYERCVYIASAFAAAAFAAWISWIPVIHLLIPGLENKTGNSVTTISHTFSEYNALVTIYLIGPVTIFFLFRTYRVFINPNLSSEEKKIFFLLLFVVQYSLFIVMRYDAVKGVAHYVFTFFTIVLLYVYHILVVDTAFTAMIPVLQIKAKTFALLLSAICVTGFAVLFMFVDDLQSNKSLYTVACLLEVCGVLNLGILDLIDIFVLGRTIQNEKQN